MQSHIFKNIESIPDVILQILAHRGICDQNQIEQFLHPSLRDLPHPRDMLNLEQAAATAVEFMKRDLPIYLWGDYDVDGTTGTALLVNFFSEIGIKVDWHIPNRLTDGYGLNLQWFEERANNLLTKPFLVITVDCGISNTAEIETINKLGGTVIVTDHHALPAAPLPQAILVNPSQKGCGFHSHNLAGVGVAFYLAAAIRAALTDEPQWKERVEGVVLKFFLSFVALGTIADMVILTLTNRILVKAGLELISAGKFPGISALLKACDCHGESISSEDISFYLAPLLNAAGRLGDSEIVVRLLTEKDEFRANRLARKLIDINTKRKSICLNNLELALSCVNQHSVDKHKCTIAKGQFHLGVAGIVASRLVDMYQVPAIVFTTEGPSFPKPAFTGSARSIDGINIVAALEHCSQYIEKFGGHAMAAGLTVASDRFEDFEKAFTAVMQTMMTEKGGGKSRIIYQYSIDSIMRDDVLAFLKLIEPFGPGNELPYFHDSSASILDARRVGRNAEHLQLTVRGKYANWKGIGFHCGDRLDLIQRNNTQKMTFFPTKNRYRGTVSWQVRVVDL